MKAGAPESTQAAVAILERLAQQFRYVDPTTRLDLLPTFAEALAKVVRSMSAPIEARPGSRVDRNASRLADLYQRLDETSEREKMRIIREQTGISKATYYRWRADAMARKLLPDPERG